MVHGKKKLLSSALRRIVRNSVQTDLCRAFQKTWPLLAGIVFVGTMLRFTNSNWDQFHAFHPDERNISWAVTRIRFWDHMNPEFFAYGGFPIYLYRIIADAVSALTHNPSWTTDWGHIAVLGRTVSAVMSSVSILLIAFVGAAYFSPAVGLVAAAIIAVSPWAVQQAHFSTTETMLVFFLLLLLSAMRPVRLLRDKRLIRTALVAGGIIGIAAGSKTIAVSYLAIPFVAYLLTAIRGKNVRLLLFPMLVTLLTGIMVFTVVSPYTFLDWNGFTRSMRYESGVALGTASVPYTLQFTGTLPYLYQFRTMLWQADIIPVLGLIGLAALILRFLCKKNPWLGIFLAFPLLYGTYVGSWFTKFDRYTVPFLPFVTIAAAWLLVEIYAKLSKKRPYLPVGLFVYLLIGLFHTWWGLANWTIYIRPQTRIEASRWIYTHIRPNATIYTEHWNDGLPVTIQDMAPVPYNRDLLTVYDPDTPQKLAYYADRFANGDVIILSTRRIWAVMPRLTEKYPLTSTMYRLLLAGSLGYRDVADFTSYPSFLGLTVNDDTAEESIQVFDHPTVRIFENVQRYSAREIGEILNGKLLRSKTFNSPVWGIDRNVKIEPLVHLVGS